MVHGAAILNNLTIKFIAPQHAYPWPSPGSRRKGEPADLEGTKGRRKRPQPYIGGLLYRTFTLQSRVVIYGCRSLIRRIRTPLSPHVCCPSIDPIYRDETGGHEVSACSTRSIHVDRLNDGDEAPRRERKLIVQGDGGFVIQIFRRPVPSLFCRGTCRRLLARSSLPSYSSFSAPFALLVFLSGIYGESFIGAGTFYAARELPAYFEGE